METTATRQSTRRIVLGALGLFALMAVVLCALAFWTQSASVAAQRDSVIADQQNLVNIERSTISNKVERLTADLLYIRDTLDLDDYASGDTTRLAADWVAFADTQMVYDQIRFIDADGDEIVRVNYSSTGSTIVPADQLQNKADRYYFADSIGLQSNQIYISKLDLNIERDSIEQPIKPMIRLCIPCYDDAGTLRGIVCMNYLAKDILSDIDRVASTANGSVYLLNPNGFWLYNEADSSTEWAFMYADRKDISFSTAYPDEWSIIEQSDDGYFFSPNGLFVFSNLLTSKEYAMRDDRYSLVLDEGDWTIVTHLAPGDEGGEVLVAAAPASLLGKILSDNAFTLLLLLVVAGLVSVLLERNRIKKARIKFYSEYDLMTGAFNRRAGLERLEKRAQQRRGEDAGCSICFIDVNGLKAVNDTLGHEAGDELILTVLSIVKESIRDGDYIIRMGGDEFIIAFDGIGIDQAEAVWQRIVDRIDAVNAGGKLRFPVSVSHGIVELAFGESLDEAIQKADGKMYEEKRVIKARSIVI